MLELRVDRESRLLILSLQPRTSRLHLIPQRPPNPLKPFPFQMLCRKELSGRLERIEQPGQDRVVQLTFQGAHRRILVAELTDRHSNLFLLDEVSTILGCQVPSRTDTRSHLTGQPYTPLPPATRPARPQNRFMERLPDQTVQQAISAFFSLEQTRIDLEELRGQVRATLRRELKRLERRRIDLEGDLRRAERAELERRYGDLLQIHLKDIPKGRSSVVVHDAFQEDEDALVEIPLEPHLDPIANIQRHYRLYRKYDASIPVVLERIESTDRELVRLARLDAGLETITEISQLRSIAREAALPVRAAPPSTQTTTRPVERKPYIRYTTPSGGEIWVGRSAADNDTLTFREARGNDFWLHVRGSPGAHVVIPARGTTPDLDTLLDAAGLALRHSGFTPGDKADVAYTRVKYVRKVPGGAPGLVTYSQDKTLFVELSNTNLSRIVRAE